MIAIGDIHGCSRALGSLLDVIQPRPADTIVTLGDYIDRGPDSRGVVERLLRLARECRLVPLVGNHEEMFSAALRDKSAIEKWLRCGGAETLRSYGWQVGGPPRLLRDFFPAEHLQFLGDCRSHHETTSHIFVHAGLLPDQPLDLQPPVVLRWRVTDRATAVPHQSGKVVVVGHTPQTSGEVLDLGFLMCIDTNCFRGGWLTAVEVISGRVWQTDRAGHHRADPRFSSRPS
jgi:serine/threonine protein phosphatase 1